MRFTSLVATAAVLSMVAAPAFAASSANPAAKLSLTDKNIRAGAPMKRTNKARGSTLVIAGVAVAAIVVGAVALGHNDSKPASS
jgi:hypothetical protein